jgi:polyhydroxyalkanoate synthase
MITTSSSFEAEGILGFLKEQDSALTPKHGAPQHRPRPLTLFLELVRQQTAGDPERMARVLKGLRAYQEAPRDAAQHIAPAGAAIKGATLRDYGGSGPTAVFIPSLINPPNVLDLTRENSLLRWLAARGHHVLLLDWGWDREACRHLSVSGHVGEIILPLLAELDELPALVGYCLGGTMAIAAAALHRVRSVATIAAPWHFSGFPDEARAVLALLWSQAEPTARAMGLLPMEVLQSAFWALDPARTVGKFERFAALPVAAPEARTFVLLEDWANDGPPVAEAAAREMFESFFRDDLTGSGHWKVGGQSVDPGRLPCPLLDIVSTSDRIVPIASSIGAGRRLELDQGHVGMIVGSNAREALWEPLAAWLSSQGGS